MSEEAGDALRSSPAPDAPAEPEAAGASAGRESKSRSKRKPIRDPFASDPFAADPDLPEASPADLKEDPFAQVGVKPKAGSEVKSSGEAKREHARASKKRRVRDPFADDPFAGAEGEVQATPAALERDPFAGVEPKVDTQETPPRQDAPPSKDAAPSKGAAPSKDATKAGRASKKRKVRDPFADDPFASAEGEVEASPVALEADPFAGVEPKAKAKSREEPKDEAKPRAKAEPKDEAKPTAKAEPRAKAEPKGEADPTAKADPFAGVEAKDEAKPTAKAEPKDEPKGEAKPKGEVKPRAKDEPRAKGEPKGEAEPRAKDEPRAKAEPKDEPKGEAKPRARAEPKDEPKGEAKPRAKAEPKDEPKGEAKPRAKDEPRAKAESKGEAKPTARAKPGDGVQAQPAPDAQVNADPAQKERAEPLEEGDPRRAKRKRAATSSAFKIDLPSPALALQPDSESDAQPPGSVPLPRRSRWPTYAALTLGVSVAAAVGVAGWSYLDRQHHEASVARLEAEAKGLTLDQLSFRLERSSPDLREDPRVQALLAAAAEEAAALAGQEQAARILRRTPPRSTLQARRKHALEALEASPSYAPALLVCARVAEVEALAKADPARPTKEVLSEALGLLYRAEAAAPQDADVALAQGLLRLRAGDTSAQEALRKAAELSPHELQGRLARGELALLRGDSLNAYEAFSSALALEATHARALWGRGEAQRRLGRYEDAQADARAAIQSDPHLGEAQVLLGRALLGEGGDWRQPQGEALEAVRSAFRRALEIYPGDGVSLGHLALLRIQLDTRGDLSASAAERQEIEAQAQAALRRAPLQAAAWSVLATLAQARGARAQVGAALSKGLPAAEAQPRALRLLLIARVRVEQGEPGDLDRIVALAPREPYGHLLRARARQRAGQLEEALRDLSRALQAAPERKDLLALRAEWLLALDPPRLAAALYDLDGYLDATPDDGEVFLRRAELLVRAEQPEEAVRDLERARALDSKPSPELSLRAAAGAAFAREEWARAAQAYQALLELSPPPADADALRERLRYAQRGASGAILLR